MFEWFIAKKYLIPKRKQLSVSLIAVMSIAVISLVVWLVLLFLSVTEGMEKTWLHKLTSLNAPIRVTPTSYYYNSYYYNIDTIASSSGYSHKSIQEKLTSSISNPYNPEEDEEVPAFWPKPDVHRDGSLKDPIKDLFACFDEIKHRHPTLVAQDYEITGALIKLCLTRPNMELSPQSSPQQSFLTQMSYIASFSEDSPFMHTLLIPPSRHDIDHLFYLASLHDHNVTSDTPNAIHTAASALYRKRIDDLVQHVKITELQTKTGYFAFPAPFLQEGSHVEAAAFLHQGKISHLLIPNVLSKDFRNMKKASSQTLLYGQLSKEQGKLYFNTQDNKLPADSLALYVEHPLNLHFVGIDQTDAARVKGLLQDQPIEGALSWDALKVTNARALQTMIGDTPPLWPYFKDGKCLLPYTQDKDQPVVLPKNFQDSGVLIGDKGFISYGVATSQAMQEQRLPVYVAGFYDPGIMAVGAKCLLMHRNTVHDIATSSNSFVLDPNLSTGVQLWFKDLSHTRTVAQELSQLLSDKGLDRYFTITTFYEYDFAKDLLQQFRSDKYLFTLIAILILLVACSNIISFLVLMVNDKKKEIGILQSMGASSKSIALIFATCGATLGILGSLIGTTGAFFTMRHIDTVVSFLSFLQGHDAFHANFYGTSLPTTLSSSAVIFMLISTPVLSIIAGLIPAIKACRLRPASILRSES